MAIVARLLENIIPEHYQLALEVDMDQFRFRVQEEIRFELKTAGRELVFHAVELKIERAELASGQQAAAITWDAQSQTVTFRFEDELAAGPHLLRLSLSGQMKESLHGFYRSRYEQDGQERWLATTQFEAVHAREALVCVDEPAAKATFELSVTAAKGLTVLSNTEVVGRETTESGQTRVQFAPTPRMSTYLLAFVVGELEYAEARSAAGVAVRVYATPGQTDQLGFALETAVRALDFYEDYFAIGYPLSKLDMVAIPDFSAGAMENWGLVTYREAALLLDPVKTSLSHKQRVAEVITHELAHQWFGNLVTMAWWDDLWLNEGFASWMESFCKDKLFPDWQVWTEFAETDMAYSMELDGLANTHSIQVPVDDPRSLDEIFDAVSYYKGSSVINMLHNYLGAEAFRQGMQNYLREHSYGNSVTHDLWQALGAASGKPVDAMMSRWTTQPGYPLVRFEEGAIRQGRFYGSPREAEKAVKEDSALWPIPFAAVLDGDRTTEPVLVTESESALGQEIVGASWFKPNAGQTGFFRSLYTEPMIEALSKPLQDGSLGPTDRFGVVSDVFATVSAGEVSSEVGLQLLTELRAETDLVVWSGLTGGFGSLQGVVEDEDLRAALDRFGLWLVGPNVERLGWEVRAGESIFDSLMRPVVLQQAIRYDHEAVTAQAQKRFATYAAGGELDPDLRPAVLFAAARHGGAKEFDILLERYRAERSPQVKVGLLSALGRFRDRSQIARYLALGLSNDVRPQDLYIVLAWSARNRYGRDLMWQWVQDNWELFEKRYGAGGHMLDRFPGYIADGFASHAMATELKAFFDSHPHPTTKRPAAQAVESIELKADWYERDRGAIERFMTNWKASQ